MKQWGFLAFMLSMLPMSTHAQQDPWHDSLIAVWRQTGLPEDERAKALSYLLYNDTLPGALERAWSLLGRAPSDTTDRLGSERWRARR